MKTSDVQIPVGTGSMPAYFAAPDTGRHPAVIVLQEIFGVNTQMRRVTDLLAQTGYAAVAINYYHRKNPDLNEPYTEAGMKAGFAAAGQVGRATYREDLEATLAWLAARDEVDASRIATWGFCMGGTVAFFSATLPGIKAAIAFYGGSIASPYANGEPEGLTDTAQVQAPLLLAFGGKDHFINAQSRERITAALDAAQKSYEIQVYSGEDHAFFRESSEAFSNPDVRDAWERVQRFLITHI